MLSPVISFWNSHLFVCVRATFLDAWCVGDTLFKQNFSIGDSPVLEEIIRPLSESVGLAIMYQDLRLIYDWHSCK